MSWADPRIARRIHVLLVRHETAADPEPLLLRGTVDEANDASASRSIVRFARAGGYDDVPVPWSSFVPTVGSEVLMRYEPATGDAYIDRALI